MLGWARGQRAAARKKIWKYATWENTLGKLPLEKILLGSFTWENTLGKLPLERILLGSFTWKNTLGKFPLGKILLGSFHLGKYSWEVAT